MVTGRKAEQIVYYRHTMYPGGLKETSYRDMMAKRPDEVRTSYRLYDANLPHRLAQVIRHAVSGMLPKNKLRQRRLDRLRIFAEDDMGPFKSNILRRWEDGAMR